MHPCKFYVETHSKCLAYEIYKNTRTLQSKNNTNCDYKCEIMGMVAVRLQKYRPNDAIGSVSN